MASHTNGTYKPKWSNYALQTDGEEPIQFLTLNERRFPQADKKMSTGKSNLKVLETYQGPTHLRDLTTKAVRTLLRPRDWAPQPRGSLFFLELSEILELCDAAEEAFKKEPTLLRLRAPIKIFGDIHGQHADLLRHFDKYGIPTIAGDLAVSDYLFLGDYVDRGSFSLEVITLLFALKIQRPNNIFLVRGNHEVAAMNSVYGFKQECVEKLGGNDGMHAWKRINEVFCYLPLAALINNKVCCMHGGFGPTFTSLSQIEQIKRPIRAYFHDTEPFSAVVNELLWSDPASHDGIKGFNPNERGPQLSTYGGDKVLEFCKANNLELIVRSHQCIMDGFERFAGGRLVTVFSATNYCGSEKNAGAILQLGRELEVIVRTIQPRFGQDHEYWDAEVNQQNPPSPMASPRARHSSLIMSDGESEDEEGSDSEDEEHWEESSEMSDVDLEAEDRDAQMAAQALAQAKASAGQALANASVRPAPGTAARVSVSPQKTRTGVVTPAQNSPAAGSRRLPPMIGAAPEGAVRTLAPLVALASPSKKVGRFTIEEADCDAEGRRVSSGAPRRAVK